MSIQPRISRPRPTFSQQVPAKVTKGAQRQVVSSHKRSNDRIAGGQWGSGKQVAVSGELWRSISGAEGHKCKETGVQEVAVSWLLGGRKVESKGAGAVGDSEMQCQVAECQGYWILHKPECKSCAVSRQVGVRIITYRG